MHEASIAEALIKTAEEELKRSYPQKVARIKILEIKVGKLSGVSVDALKFAFEILKKGTSLEDAELKVEEPKAVCNCRSCGKTSEIDDLFQGCPLCKSFNIDIKGGDELLIESIEVEE